MARFMPNSDNTYWTTDEAFFLALEGGKEVADWFGFVPSFHDATIEKLELSGNNGKLSLKAFRMTDVIDAAGYFILDRHAVVDVLFQDITGVVLKGDAAAVIQEFGLRKLENPNGIWETTAGPVTGDIEARWECSVGLEGALYARSVRFALNPL